jgi:hypothetical protein
MSKRGVTSPPSILVVETDVMQRRFQEQQQAGVRQLARIEELPFHHENAYVPAPSEEMGQSLIKERLLSQALDGVAERLSAMHDLDPEARADLENELRLQHQKKLDMQQQLSNTHTPKPSMF